MTEYSANIASMDQVTLSILIGLLTMTTLGIANSMPKPVTAIIGVKSYMFIRNLVISSLLFAVAFSKLFQTNFDLWNISLSLIFSILGYFGLSYLFKALKTTKVGLASPASSVNVVFSIFLTYVFLCVKLSLIQFVAILVIIFGIFMIRFDPKALKNHLSKQDLKGINYALLSGALMGVFIFLTQIPARVIGPILTPASLEAGMFLFGGSLFLVKREKVKIPDKKNFVILFVSLLFLAVAIVSFYYGLVYANPAIVLALYSSNPVSATLYGAFVYRERLTPVQYVAIAIIVAGIISLRVFS